MKTILQNIRAVRNNERSSNKRNTILNTRALSLVVTAGLCMSAIGSSSGDKLPQIENAVFDYEISYWEKFRRSKDNDLLTAGLMLSGIQSNTPPPSADARQLAYYSNIRALVDTSSNGGFGRLYGPGPKQVITGLEYIAAIQSSTALSPAEFSVQIPDTFDLKQPCLVVAPSSGSRDIYGAVGVAGFWALQNNCAIAYTNKGTGTGFYFVQPNKLIGIGGKIETPKAHLNWVKPNEKSKSSNIGVATRHAHSTLNPEKDWGRHTLIAAEIGIKALSDHFKKPFLEKDILVIAASISNGGSAVLRAGELDETDLIDAIVAGEPNVNVNLKQFNVETNDNLKTVKPKHALETFIVQSIYSACANYSVLPNTVTVAAFKKQAELACEELRKTKLLSGNTTEQLAQLAQQVLIDFGVSLESLWLGPIYNTMGLWEALESTYPSAYARLRLYEDPCGRSFEMASSSPLSTNSIGQLDKLWSISSGIPPVASINLGWHKDIRSDNKRLQAFNLQTAAKLCYLSWLYPEFKSNFNLTDTLSVSVINALQNGMTETTASANLRGKPTIIVHGRSDRLILVNHSSRPYYYLNQTRHSKQSNLRYIEVLNANHFDALLSYPPYNQNLVPLHSYFEQALDSIIYYYYKGDPLPKSQVIQPKLRQLKKGQLEPLSDKHVISIKKGAMPISVTKDGIKLLL